MTRNDVATYLGAVLDDLLADTGIAATDTSGNLKEPLDDALRSMGTATADLATAEPDDDRRFLLTAEYHTLRRMLAKLAVRFRLSTGGTALSLEQVHDHVKDRFDEVKAELIAAYGSVDGGAASGASAIYMPFLDQTEEEWSVVIA